MKRIFLFILIVLSHGVNAANGETWSCSYQYSNEIKNKVLIRDSNIFKDESGAIVSTYINETKDFIHIYNTIGSFGTYFATLLDKNDKKFQRVAIGLEDFRSAIINGSCIVY